MSLYHASALTVAAEIQPIEFQNQRAVPIRSCQLMGDHILSLDPCFIVYIFPYITPGWNKKQLLQPGCQRWKVRLKVLHWQSISNSSYALSMPNIRFHYA